MKRQPPISDFVKSKGPKTDQEGILIFHKLIIFGFLDKCITEPTCLPSVEEEKSKGLGINQGGILFFHKLILFCFLDECSIELSSLPAVEEEISKGNFIF